MSKTLPKLPCFLLCIVFLTGCGTVPMFMDLGDDQVLRGSAKGMVGSKATFQASDLSEAISCKGQFSLPVTASVTQGTVSCNNGWNGHFKINGAGASWIGEGVFENGKAFKILINYLTDPEKS